MKRSSVFHLLLSTSTVAGAFECHPQGPILPRPSHLAQSEIFQDAVKNLTESLEAAVTGKIKAGWDTRNVSLSIGIITRDQPDRRSPLWEYHHLASGNVNGTGSIDKNSQYLIGSISKVISDTMLLRSGVDIDDPITKYIPTLNTSSSLIDWNAITLRALASQLSGIPPNCRLSRIGELSYRLTSVPDGFSEYYYLKDYFEYLGYPHLNDSAFGSCGVTGLNAGCSKDGTWLSSRTQVANA